MFQAFDNENPCLPPQQSHYGLYQMELVNVLDLCCWSAVGIEPPMPILVIDFSTTSQDNIMQTEFNFTEATDCIIGGSFSLVVTVYIPLSTNFKSNVTLSHVWKCFRDKHWLMWSSTFVRHRWFDLQKFLKTTNTKWHDDANTSRSSSMLSPEFSELP